MDRVAFITAEDGDDLIVSFAVVHGELGEVQSVTLMRTPKYEFIFEDAERGVNFSDERSEEEVSELLRELHFEGGVAAVKTDRADYVLDISKVDPDEVAEAARIFRKMNFDQRFLLVIA